MGIFINPENKGFSETADKDYVDKTGFIGLINDTTDSHEFFDLRAVALSKDYSKHFNKYNEICFGVTGFVSDEKAVNYNKVFLWLGITMTRNRKVFL